MTLLFNWLCEHERSKVVKSEKKIIEDRIAKLKQSVDNLCVDLHKSILTKDNSNVELPKAKKHIIIDNWEGLWKFIHQAHVLALGVGIDLFNVDKDIKNDELVRESQMFEEEEEEESEVDSNGLPLRTFV